MTEPNMQTYHGSCHCGAFQYSVKLPVLKQVMACNCSICTKKGYLCAFLSSDDLFVVEKGDGTLKEYQFGNKTLTHGFCPNCGTSVMGKRHVEAGPFIVVNVRTLENVDVRDLEFQKYDGAKLEPAYKSLAPSKPTNTKDNIETYNGSCHCGKVTYELKSQPLNEIDVTECNCSICSRNAYLWLYPKKTDVRIQGDEHLHCYRFGSNTAGHSFCTTCGVSLLNEVDMPGGGGPQPVNIRALNGVDLDNLRIKQADGKSVVDLKQHLLDKGKGKGGN